MVHPHNTVDCTLNTVEWLTVYSTSATQTNGGVVHYHCRLWVDNHAQPWWKKRASYHTAHTVQQSNSSKEYSSKIGLCSSAGRLQTTTNSMLVYYTSKNNWLFHQQNWQCHQSWTNCMQVRWSLASLNSVPRKTTWRHAQNMSQVCVGVPSVV